MIHFFPRFAKNAQELPYGEDLRATGTEHRIFGAQVQQRYRYRFQLLLLGYPRLALAALKAARASLITARDAAPDAAPDAVVISSDVEVLVFALVKLLPAAAKPRIVFMPFIFTERSSPVINRLRHAYYRFILRQVSCAICHSRLEIPRYQALFAGCGTDFVFVPWGTFVPSIRDIEAAAKPQPATLPHIVAAGRSGRDYPTLLAAAASAACSTTIICNEAVALQGAKESPNVNILTECFGLDYLAQLLHADIVVVPLRVDNISAGQMVLIQAMALERPLIVTETPTIGDYLEHNVTALLVPRGNAPAMAAAITALLSDPERRRTLGRNARESYLRNFSGAAHARQVVEAIRSHLDRARVEIVG